MAIVRLSGPNALATLWPLFSPSRKVKSPETHQLIHGHLYDQQGNRVDEIMFVYMAAPRTFTAEEVVEVHCHAGQQTVTRVVDVCLVAGARLARPGEFSYRAFANGRIDLTQAEAIADLIHSRSAAAQSLAVSQLGGTVSRSMYEINRQIRDRLALLEAWLDFPEEDLPDEDLASLQETTRLLIDELCRICETYNTGRFYAEGVSLLLLGRPNVGKSSLMNALLGEERAIVTEVAGTTRDLLEEGLVINGLPIRLIDTAGIRNSVDPVESVGVERATRRLETADLVLVLVDGSIPLTEDDLQALALCGDRPALLVLTKSDKGSFCDLSTPVALPCVSVSSHTGEGLDQLRTTIFDLLVGTAARNDNSVLLTNARHKEAASKALDALRRFSDALGGGMSLEFLAADLREALSSLGEITGETTTDDILDSIFSRFCIGK